MFVLSSLLRLLSYQIILYYQSDEVFLEAQVQNVTNGNLSLEKVLLEPSQLFGVTSLNNVQEEDESGATVTR